MKTGEKILQVSPLLDVPGVLPRQVKRRWHWPAILRSPLWFCLLLTLLVRVWLVIHTHGFIDMDEALEGIQAQHILRGELPIYYYGQPYMGSLEAYLLAGLFAFAGSSVWTLRAVPILLSLVVVYMTWHLAGAIADEAKLVPPVRRWFATVTALLAALPPLYDAVIELRAWGGHIEIYILMLGLLYSVLRLTQRWRSGAARGELALRWAGIGFIIGLGMWVYPLIISAVLACALWVVSYFATCVWRAARRGQGRQEAITLHIRNLLLAVAALPACLLGFSPGIYWGAQHKWANVLYLLSPGSDGANNPVLLSHYPNRLAVIVGTTGLYARCLIPHLVGGSLPSEPITQSSPFSFTLLTALGVACVITNGGLVAASFCWRPAFLLAARRLVALPLLFAACTALVFCCSNVVGSSLLVPCTRDGVGRYAAPLLLALPFFLGAAFTVVYEHLYKKSALPHFWRDISASLQTTRAHSRSVFGSGPGMYVLHGLLIVYLCVVGNTYMRSNQGYVFQSFACLWAPLDDGALITYVQRQHIHYAWGTITLGNPLMFKTNNSVIVADPRIFTTGALNRLPQNALAVKNAQYASLLDLVPHDDRYPLTLKWLDQNHILYRMARFPTTPGNMDVLVVTPVNHTLKPSEARSFGSWASRC